MHSQSSFYGNSNQEDALPLIHTPPAYPRMADASGYQETVEINLNGNEDDMIAGENVADNGSPNSHRVIVRTLPGRLRDNNNMSESNNHPPCIPERCPRSMKLCLLFNPLYYRCLIRLFCQVSSAKHLWCINDPCGFICAMFTWALMLYGEFVIVYVCLGPVPSSCFRWINGFIFNFFWLLALFSHVKAVFSDPGAIPLGNANIKEIRKMGFVPNQIIYRCPKCDCIKPERAHHCSICQRCIRKMDHHCPWINNCVGEMNQKYFVLFTFYIFLMSIYGVYISVHFFFICVGTEWEGCSGNRRHSASLWAAPSPAAATIFLLTAIAEGAMFGLFTLIMFCSQLFAICRDKTGIEQLKNSQNSNGPRYRSRWQGLEGTFGSPSSWRWLSPFHSPFPVSFSTYPSGMDAYNTV